MNHKLSFFSIDTLSNRINYPKLSMSDLCISNLRVPKCIVPYVGITAVVGGTLGIMGSSVLFHTYYPPKNTHLKNT
jgi:hypothetical protein